MHADCAHLKTLKQKRPLSRNLMNFLTLSGLSAMLHAYVALRLIPDLAAFASARLLLAGVLFA